MLPIGEFSKIGHVTTKTLRYYDEIGLLKPVWINNATGYRYYDVQQLKTLLQINRLKGYGFTLEEVAGILTAPLDQQLLLSILKQKQNEHKEKIALLRYALKQMEQDVQNLKRGVDIMSYFDKIAVTLAEPNTQHILSIRKKMNVADYGSYMNQLQETLTREKLTALGPPMSIFHDETYNPESYDMEIAIPVKEAVKGTKTLSPGLCATTTLNGPYSQLPEAYAKLKSWMETEGYEGSGSPYEVYLTNPFEVAADENVTAIYMPVKKR